MHRRKIAKQDRPYSYNDVIYPGIAAIEGPARIGAHKIGELVWQTCFSRIVPPGQITLAELFSEWVR